MSDIDVTKAAGMSDDELREKFEKQQGHGSYTVHAGKETKYYTGAEIGAIKRAYQRRINTDDAYAQNAFKSYTQSGFDKYAYENDLPSLAMWNDMEKYAKGGGVSENYSNVTDEQWNKINELWKKDWEYGLTDEDVRRKALGLAPVAYDDMYEDTLLDAELKQNGLPPSKLLNGKLGETYREWSSNAKKNADFFDEATRKYISENDTENTAKRGASNVASVLSGGKASSGYSMEDALRDTMNDPKWMDYAHQHYGMSMAIPNPDDEDFLVKEDGVPKIGEDGEKVYDQEKYKKAWDNATKNNLGIDNDEFAITIDKLQQYYNENGTVTKADMAAQEWFENKGIKFDYDTRFENEDYVAKMNDLYAGELVNDGEGFTLDTLFPDAQFTEEDRKAYQPVVDELNRLRLEEGYDAAREYFLSDEFSTALRSVDNDRIVASLREQNADVDGYDKKTDAEILHSYYDRIGKSYLMTDDEIAKLESGELTVDQYMASKCSTEEDAVAFANAQYEAYCKKNNLPITADEWKAAIESWDAASDYFTREVPDSEKPLLDTSENEWDQLLKDWTPIATKYATRADAYNDGGESAAEEWQYARDIVSEAKIAKQYWENIRSVDSYCDPSKSWDDQMRFSAMQRDDANIKKLAYRADAFAYTPEFAAKTADKSYVDQRFESIVNRRADEGIETPDLTPAVLAEIPVIGKLASTAYVVNEFFNGPDVKDLHEYATDEDKAKIVYMFDKTGRDETNRVISLEAETYLNKYMTHKWDAIRRADKAEQSNYFNSEGKTGFGRWVGATATVLNATASGLVEAPSNLLTDTATILLGKEMYSSNRLTTSSDRMSNLSQHLVDRDGNKIGAFAINLIPSMAQSGASMALAAATNGASEAFTLALMGTQSYSNAVDTALQNGASAEQAYVYGLMNGANEIIFEKLSLDKFVKDIDVVRAAVDAARKTGKYSSKQLTGILAKEMLRRANRQGLVEGSEEFFTSIANLLAENWILADKSARSKTIQHYVDAGMSEEDAAALADKEIFNDVLVDFIGGYVSGFLMAAGGDLIKTSGGRFFVDRTGVTDFVTATHNLSIVSFDNALSYAKANLEVDSDGKISAASAKNVFNDLRKQGADAATLSRVMNEYSDNATPDAQTAMRTAITEQKAEDGKKLTNAARKYVYNRVAHGKSNVTKGQIEFATKEWLDHYSGAVQQGDIRELANNARMMREGYIEDIARLAVGSYAATGMTQMSEYYASLPVDAQQQIAQNAEQYKATFNEAFADGNRAAQYANVAAIMEYAVGEGKALQGLNSIFGDSAAVAPQAVRNAILGTDSTTAQRYVERVAESVALLNRQNGNHLFSAAQNGVDATAYVATQFALAQSMPTDSLSRSMYDYIAKYGATNEALDLLTAATIHESGSPFARQIRITTGTFYTTEQLQQITNEYQKALTDYNDKLKIKQAHEQADTQERAEHESRIANYTAQVEQLEKNVKEDTSLAKTFGSRVAELQTAKSAFETLIAKQNQRMTQTNADVAQAESKYKAAKTKYWNAMQDQAAQYIQRFGSSLEAIKGKQRISHAELTRMSALAQYGTAENLNDINTKIIASEKASAVALGSALGVDVQCVAFSNKFFDEQKIPKSARDYNSPGVVIKGTVYLNTEIKKTKADGTPITAEEYNRELSARAKVGFFTDQVLIHELGHVMELSVDNYKKYAKFAKDFLIKRDKAGYEYTKNSYIKSGMNEQQAERECIAEFTRQVALADPRAVTALCKSAPKMSMRIFQWLTNTRNRMDSVATEQSKIIIDAQREFAKGMKAIRNNKVAAQNVDNTSLSPTRDTMVNATKQLQERMRLEAENQRNATQQTTEQQPTQAQQQTDQKTEAQTETPTATAEQQSAEEASVETVEETPEETNAEEPVVAEAEQTSETVEETPAEAETPVAEETVEETPSEEPVAEEQTTEEPQEDFADVVLEEPQGHPVPYEPSIAQTEGTTEQETEQPVSAEATEQQQASEVAAEEPAAEPEREARPAPVYTEIVSPFERSHETRYHGGANNTRIERNGFRTLQSRFARQTTARTQASYAGYYDADSKTYKFGKSQDVNEGGGGARHVAAEQMNAASVNSLTDANTFVETVFNRGYLPASELNTHESFTDDEVRSAGENRNTAGENITFTDEQKSQLKKAARKASKGDPVVIRVKNDSNYEAVSLQVLREMFASLPDAKRNKVSYATAVFGDDVHNNRSDIIITDEATQIRDNSFNTIVDLGDVSVPQAEATAAEQAATNTNLPFNLTSETRDRIMRVVAQLRSANADSEGRVPKKTNDTIAKLVKNQVTHDANYVETSDDVLDAFAEQFKAPQRETEAVQERHDWTTNYRSTENRNAGVAADSANSQAIEYYTEYDPQALEIQRSINGLTERENAMSGRPRMIQTSNGYMVARQVSREGLEAGNPMFNTRRQNIAMIAPVSEFRGDVKRPVSVSQCTAVVVPNSDAYAETRADARNAGANVYAYDESDPSQFDRAIDRAANMSSVAYFPSMTYDELIAQYNAIPQGMKPRVENRRVPRQTTDRNRVSQTARTISEAPITTEQGYSNIQSWIVNDNAGTFDPVSNTKSLNRARGVIERAGSLSQAAEDLHSVVANNDGKATDLLARAELLYAEAQNPNSGLTAIQREHIFSDLCMIASDAGRALQLTSQLKRMTPEGHIDYIEQVGKRMADKYNKRTKKNVVLTLTEEEKEAYRNAKTDEQRKEVDKEVGKRWAEETKDLPLLERIRNWRYFAMLGNARTHFRNMVGNAMMNPVARAKDFNNTWLQRVFEHVGNEDTRLTEADRTTTYVTGRVDSTTKNFVDEQLKRMLPVMQAGSSKYMEEIAKASPVEDEDIEGPWLKRLAKVLTQPVNSARLSNSDKGFGKLLNKLSYINSNALELEDAKALGWRFRTAMYEIIKARNIDVTNITDEQLNAITNYAAEEALRATFRDASVLADALNRFANTNRATRFAMEAIVPFKKTPINIAKRSFEYSPIGLVNGMYKLFSNNSQYKSEVSRIESDTKLTDAQKQQRIAEATAKAKQQKVVAIDRLASGVTGSLMTAIGFVAASMGWISIGRKDDDKASFEQALGKNAYSLNIGDLSIDLSAFSPAAVPMLMGTALYQSTSAEHDPNFVSSMVDVLAESIDPITEMSMISGIADALSGIGSQREDGANTRWAMQIAGNAVESYIGQFVPTFVGQAERALDPYTRSYTAGDEYWASKAFGSEIGSAVKGLQNKAGFGWLAEPKVNLHGEEQRNYTNLGSWVRNVLNNTILPATIKVDQKNEIDDELVRLYGVVDSADIFPSKPSRNLGSYNGEPIKLTNDKEYMEYQKEYGQTVYDLLEDLMMSREYQYMTDDQRASAVEKIIDQAKSATKKRWKAMKAQEQK